MHNAWHVTESCASKSVPFGVCVQGILSAPMINLSSSELGQLRLWFVEWVFNPHVRIYINDKHIYSTDSYLNIIDSNLAKSSIMLFVLANHRKWSIFDDSSGINHLPTGDFCNPQYGKGWSYRRPGSGNQLAGFSFGSSSTSVDECDVDRLHKTCDVEGCTSKSYVWIVFPVQHRSRLF